MKSFYLMDNTVRDYAWGSPSQIPDFTGQAHADGVPAAELWMGAHPGAPSGLLSGEDPPVLLDGYIADNPRPVLGPSVSDRYGRLPFLFKLLAAENVLSIQAHPDKRTAEEGYERENRAGIPVDAPYRNYRDDNHKPEIIVALESFSAMAGFRRPEHISRAFQPFMKGPAAGLIPASVMEGLGRNGDAALEPFLRTLLTMSGPERGNMILRAADLLPNAGEGQWDALQVRWIGELGRQFPGDTGILAPLFLNIVELAPGQALFQPAGTLHAYLKGFGIELMANSDNVLRGGLTAKNVDVDELLRILDFRSTDPQVLTLGTPSGQWAFYPTPADEFRLGVFDGTGDKNSTIIQSGRGPLILLALDKPLTLAVGSESLSIVRGASAFIPWSAEDIHMRCSGRVAMARVGQ